MGHKPSGIMSESKDAMGGLTCMRGEMESSTCPEFVS